MDRCSNLLKCFTTQELMRWPGIQGIYGETLRATSVFGPESGKRWEDLHTRVIEHVRPLYFILPRTSSHPSDVPI